MTWRRSLTAVFLLVWVGGCVVGDLVLVKVARLPSADHAIMEVQTDDNSSKDPNVSERQEDLPGNDRRRDPGAFMELWPGN